MKKTSVMAYYFPNWHPTPMNDEWHGKDWTEWEVVKSAVPRYEGHDQPKIPVWGYEDEADVKVMEKKIAFAKENGLDGFIWDWYWFNEGPYRRECLDNAFLKAKNNKDLKFSVMWCNHDPINVHPASYAVVKNKMTKLLDGHITKETFIEGTDYCIKNYFNRENYLRIDGKLYFTIFGTQMLIESFGGLQECRAMLDDFRDRVRKAGLGEINIATNAYTIYTGDVASTDGNSMFDKAFEIGKKAGFDSAFVHNNLSDGKNSFPFMKYDDVKDYAFITNDEMQAAAEKNGMGFYPSTTVGWDTSPRIVPSDKLENIGYPFNSMIDDSTPEKFEKWLRMNKEFCDKHNTPLLSVFAFNEWTEGGYLEPDKTWGDAYIKAIKRVFGD